ncbi:DNA-binding protein [Spirochaetia bacterium]|nr:DNA-binding protein [Spirochaetia bacterium]
MISYYDSSLLLAILFDEERQSEADALWRGASDRVSSILLRIESLVSLRRFFELNKHKLDTLWLVKKTAELNDFLSEVTYLNIDKTIESVICSNKNLSKCRTLDAIHVATALDIRTNNNDNINLYTFDTDMHSLAVDFDFITNQLRP